MTHDDEPCFLTPEDDPSMLDQPQTPPEPGPSWWEGQWEGGIASLEELEQYVDWRLTHFISLAWSGPKSLRDIGEELGAQTARNAVRWLNRDGDPQPPTLTSADLANLVDLENALHRILRHIRNRQGILKLDAGPSPADSAAGAGAQSPLPPVARQEQGQQPGNKEAPAEDERDDAGKGLARCHHVAYGAYELAIERAPHLKTDREVYDWLVANEHDLHDGCDLPNNFDTFARYLRAYRDAHGLSKRSSRRGRGHGRSVVRRNQV